MYLLISSTFAIRVVLSYVSLHGDLGAKLRVPTEIIVLHIRLLICERLAKALPGLQIRGLVWSRLSEYVVPPAGHAWVACQRRAAHPACY